MWSHCSARERAGNSALVPEVWLTAHGAPPRACPPPFTPHALAQLPFPVPVVASLARLLAEGGGGWRQADPGCSRAV